MRRVAGCLLCVLFAAPLIAQNAPPVDDKIDSPLEYFFGALAVIALVMTWLWLWLKTKRILQPRDLGPPEPGQGIEQTDEKP